MNVMQTGMMPPMMNPAMTGMETGMMPPMDWHDEHDDPFNDWNAAWHDKRHDAPRDAGWYGYDDSKSESGHAPS